MTERELMSKQRLNILHPLIWSNPYCLLTGTNYFDIHHIKGRGGKHLQDMHESPFNKVPICRAIHIGGAKHQPEIEAFFLRKVREKVMGAVLPPW